MTRKEVIDMGQAPVPLGVFSMGDVAQLCRVRRPVVTTWRRRTSIGGDHVPFPPSCATADGVELFDSAAVVQWLRRTGRGNNPEAHLDAAAFTRPPLLHTSSLSIDDAVMALLCLKSVSGTSLVGLDVGELLDLADEVDPDNDALYAEVEQLGADGPTLAGYVEALAEAAYGVEAAVDAVRARSTRTRGQGARSVALAPEAHQLVARLVAQLALGLGSTEVTVRDGTHGVTELTLTAVAALDNGVDRALAVSGDGMPARARRREALILGVPLHTSVSADEPAVVLAQLPHAAEPDMSPAQMLTAIDNIQLELGPDQRAVVIGPAAVLCDRLSDPETDRHRDELIRGLARLRAAVRLPEGLLVGRSRERLGLWVLGPSQPEARDQRWVAVADVAGQRLTPAVIDDLVTDVVTVMAPVRIGTMHAFHYAAVMPTATLLSSTGGLVPHGAGPRGRHTTGGAKAVLAVEDLLRSLRDRPSGGLDGWGVLPSVEPTSPRTESLGTLVAMRGITRVPGVRMPRLTPSPTGVRVVGVDDVVAGNDPAALYVDPLALESAYPRARRTEPGDVVFVTSPRPAALVDRDGLSVVRSPAMVLRCAEGSGVLPEVLAATINALPDRARSWCRWQIPLLPSGRSLGVDAALNELAAERRRSRDRLRMLDELSTRLIDGVASGSMTVNHTTDTDHEGEPS